MSPESTFGAAGTRLILKMTAKIRMIPIRNREAAPAGIAFKTNTTAARYKALSNKKMTT